MCYLALNARNCEIAWFLLVKTAKGGGQKK